MQQPSAPSSASPSFAGLMAALAEPAHSPANPSDKLPSPVQRSASAWNEDDLADDVATLSYESALKAHARYRYADQSLTQLPDPVPFCFEEASSAAPQPEPRRAPAYPAPGAAANPKPQLSPLRVASVERNLKDASITIRMSKEECAQLHRRAADAGLTVSAYLRSCTFEAESLRAMVKDTLAQLRSAQTQANPANPAPQPRQPGMGRLAHLLTPWRGQRAARI